MTQKINRIEVKTKNGIRKRDRTRDSNFKQEKMRVSDEQKDETKPVSEQKKSDGDGATLEYMITTC